MAAQVALRQLSPTIENYDLKNASLRLAGRDVLEEIPKFDVKDIPPFEFARLICNRTAGVLSTWLPVHSRSPQYCANQYVKACIAVGDVAVYIGKHYHPSYRERQKLFVSLAKKHEIPFCLSDDAITLINSAYSNKLGNDAKNGFRIDDMVMRDMIDNTFLAIAARCLGEKVNSVRAAGEALVRHYRDHRTLIERIDDLVCIWLRPGTRVAQAHCDSKYFFRCRHSTTNAPRQLFAVGFLLFLDSDLSRGRSVKAEIWRPWYGFGRSTVINMSMLIAFIFGAVVGSFLNVCIGRIPNDESVIHPPSHCPKCKVAIAFYDNVPLVSYFLLRGRCRACSQSISPRYFPCRVAHGSDGARVVLSVWAWF